MSMHQRGARSITKNPTFYRLKRRAFGFTVLLKTSSGGEAVRYSIFITRCFNCISFLFSVDFLIPPSVLPCTRIVFNTSLNTFDGSLVRGIRIAFDGWYVRLMPDRIKQRNKNMDLY